MSFFAIKKLKNRYLYSIIIMDGGFMKKKTMWILGGIVVLLFVVVAVICVKILFYPSGIGVYGNRLEGIENYPISADKIEEIKGTILESKDCESITYSLQGKIMKFFINVSKDTGIISSQRLGDNIIDSFSDTELSYYDVSIYVTSSEQSEPYPMIGYKSKNETAISWTVNKGEVNEE